MKKIILYCLFGFSAVNGVMCMETNVQFTFFWWIGFINLMVWGVIFIT